MSYHQKLLSLLSGIDDPTIRMEVFRTVAFLYEVYTSGQASEDEIASDLFEVVYNVIAVKHPELTEEEAKKKAEQFVKEILQAFRLESMSRRIIGARTRRRGGGIF